MIATFPRSGSTAFGLSLWSTGILGAPLEYAHAVYAADIRERIANTESYEVFWAELQRRRTTPNGVFSYKMMKPHILQIARKHYSAFSSVMPTHTVLFRRRDRAAHAVSMSKAIQTSQWFSDHIQRRPPRFNLSHLLWCESIIAEDERFWVEFLRQSELPFIEVFYEDFLADRAHELERIFDFVGCKVEDMAYNPSLEVTEVQRDGTSEIWRRRLLDAKRLLNRGFMEFDTFHALRYAD
ncbi:Stf0 family sulfotransferase [Roseateles sp. BYS78W]|uniref:Stf0 family sulfotransferase n=1 Tax=Pelomonas candidula TaxID=3299025 RepID=A0ABW7HIP8_9BURK